MYRLLVVEDEPLVREGICSLIDHPNLGIGAVYQASDGERAWQLVQQHQLEIVLSDINMPGLDGISLAKRIKEQYPNTRIVFLTGYDYFDYAVSAVKLGADDYVLKPLSRSDIEAVLRRTVNKLRQQAQQQQAQQLLEQRTEPAGTLGQAIQHHLSNPQLSLTFLAKELGFNATYLSTLIKKELGINFQDYVGQQRMERAKLLLLTTPLKVYEIAREVGFEDINYFSMRFKQVVGVTPRQYQKGDNAW